MGFQHGLSGLNGASKSLDVIGNNIANAGTAGFKGAQAQFADVYAASLNGSGGTLIGIGSKLAAAPQQFTQGNISTTNNPLDVAINGNGFFRMSANGVATFTRNGQFQLDKNGFIVNSAGMHLTGYDVDAAGNISATNPADIQLTAAKQSVIPSPTGSVGIGVNLDSRSIVPPTPVFNPLDSTSFNTSTSVNVYDSLGNSHVLSTYFVKEQLPAVNAWDVFTTFDGSLVLDPVTAYAPVLASTQALGTGGAGVNSINTRATAVQAAWPVGSAPYVAATNAIAAAAAATAAAAAMGAAPSTQALISAAVGAAKTAAADMALMNNAVIASPPTGAPQIAEAALTATANTAAQTALTTAVGAVANTLTFSSSGLLATTPMPIVGAVSVTMTNGAATPLTLDLNFAGSTQFGANFSVNTLTQDGFTAGNLAGFNISGDGKILGRYTNGQSKLLGQVVLANFSNPQGLQPLGNNQWAETSESGPSLIGEAGTGKFGSMQSGATEDSNVDLTAELVNMITAQRIYQANAQTIKTQDAVMQTLVNLR